MGKKPKRIKRGWVPERKAFSRPRDFSKFYNSTRWRKVARARKVNNPYCVQCEAKGIVSPNQVTDHIRGLGFLLDNGIDPYSEKELQDLCNKCHNIKSGREAHRRRG